jgi:uncharacterized protein involved in cysteine biosynthesis
MNSRTIVALGKGIVSQFHPRMLALLVVPLVVAVAVWGISAWYFWTPVTSWLRTTWFTGDGLIARGYAWVAQYGLAGLDQWVPNLFGLLLIVPVAIATALALVAVLAMPAVIRFLGKREYADVERLGTFGVIPSLGNVLKAIAIFVPGYLLTIPLWLIPPLALIIPWLWWGWLTARLMRFDSSVEHANAEERERLIRRDRSSYMVLGLACAALNYIPPLFLIAPVLSALVFAHYSLSRLREMRTVAPRVIVQEKLA